jgi:hypothetical protein
MNMAQEEEKRTPGAKISPGFAARLERLGPEDKVRAIVMLQTGSTKGASKRRPTPARRKAAVKNVRRAVHSVLPDIDRILKRHRGHRLESDVDALGAVPVVTTAAGINALTASEHVRAILEDQPVYGLN